MTRRRRRSASGWSTALGRFVAAAVVVLSVAALPWMSGSDPARTVLRARTGNDDPTAEQLVAVRDELHLADGPVRHLVGWLGGLLRGDAGDSWVSRTPVMPQVSSALGVSATLMAGALVVTVVVAAVLATRTLLLGLRDEGRSSRVAVVTAVLAAVPKFALAAVLATVGGVWLRWFPSQGWSGPSSMVLPSLALGIPTGAVIGGLVEHALPATLHEPWVRTRRAFGLSDGGLARSALRRALSGVVPQLVPSVVALVGGAVAVEQIFNIPGLGRLALQAALSQDLPVLQLCVVALLLLGMASGWAVRCVRLLMLGPALRDGALPALAEPRLARPRLLTWLGLGSAIVLAGLVLAGLLRDPMTVDSTARLLAPGPQHPLGTDSLGRDLLARIGHGAWRTVAMALVVTGVSVLVGGGIGLLRGWGVGATEVMATLPAVLAGLLTVAVVGPSSGAATIALCLVAWVPYAAQTAALVEQERASGHVLAAVALGVPARRILRRHVLPAVVPAVLRNALLRLPTTVLVLASLGFLGLGQQPPAPEWGRLLSENQPYAELAPWVVLAPAAALVLLSVTTLVGIPAAGRARRAR